MLRKCTRYIFLLLLAILIIPSSIYFANPKESVSASSSIDANKIFYTSSNVNDSTEDEIDDSEGYYITSFDVNMVVGENNVLHITETIDAFFTIRSHGIYRQIPTVNNITRVDGSTDTVRARVKNIKVNNEFTKEKSGNNIKIKIGEADKYIIGEQSYTISYDYNLGKDRSKDFDELYFNLIGTGWRTDILKVAFRIEMPKEFDASLVGFTSGYSGSTTSNVEFSVDGNVISGYTTSKLKRYQAVTIRLELPEGYFVGARSIEDVLLIIAYLIPSAVILFLIFAYFALCRKNKFVETVEFYPPEGLNSLEVALVYNGSVSGKDVMSLLVYLADKGYIELEEVDSDGNLLRAKKLKEYNGDDSSELTLMEALFSSKDNVVLESLRDTSFPSKVHSIAHTLNNSNTKDKYFDKKFAKFRWILTLLGLLAMIVPASVLFSAADGIILIYLFPVVAFLILKAFMSSHGMKVSLVMIAFMSIWGGIPLLIALGFIKAYSTSFFWANILGVCAAVLILLTSKKFLIRTKMGGETYAKIRGFRRFIKTAEKERLEMLCAEQPSYFYDILPFAYVLGVSNVWIKNFEYIATEQPDWYSSRTGTIFSVSRCSRIFRSANVASTSRPSSSGGSSGGGFSSGGGSGGGGGGRSGGGSGGGGGGRW